MPKTLNINALGQAIDTTWGRSSTPQTASYSVKVTFLGADRLLASYKVITNFVSESEMVIMKRDCKEESQRIIKKYMDHVKSVYKELTGESLSLKEVKDSTTDSIEIIGFNVHNPKRTAYYRSSTIFEIA